MATFWAIVIGGIFVVAVVALLVFGGRYLRAQKQAHGGETLPSSRDKRARDRREEQLNRNRDTTQHDTSQRQSDRRDSGEQGGNVRVYRN